MSRCPVLYKCYQTPVRKFKINVLVPWKSSGLVKKFGFKSDCADDPGIVLVLVGNTIVFKLGGLFMPLILGTPKVGLDRQKIQLTTLILQLT